MDLSRNFLSALCQKNEYLLNRNLLSASCMAGSVFDAEAVTVENTGPAPRGAYTLVGGDRKTKDTLTALV